MHSINISQQIVRTLCTMHMHYAHLFLEAHENKRKITQISEI